MNSSTPCRARIAIILITFGALLPGLSGCNMIGFAASVVTGDGTQTQRFKAEYRGLENKSVAVIVAADEYMLYENPGSQLAISRAVSKQMAVDMPGIKLANPQDVAHFQTENPYWSTLPNRQILDALKVQRLVYIDLTELSTHDPGNSNEWRGVIVANVSVAEADAADPDNFVYRSLVNVKYPTDRSIGVLEANDQSVRLGMLKLFGSDVSDLFHDHEKVVPKW